MAKTELEEAGEDTEGMVESTAKLRDLIKGISGVDIMIDANTFKSTYQIIDELGRVWKDINDIDQAAILEAIAGKRQSNIVAATLNNYERLEEILRISKDSAGSAMKEQQEYAKSIRYSLDRAKAAYQSLAQTIVDSNLLKDLIDTGAALLTILDTIGKITKKIGSLGTDTIKVRFSIFGILNDAIIQLGDFANLLFGDENYIDDFSEKMRVLAGDSDNLAESFNAGNDAIEKYEDIIGSVKDVNEGKTDLLSLQSDLIASFGDEAKAIDLVNGKYEDNINKIRSLNEKEYRDWYALNADRIAEAEKFANLDVGWVEIENKYYDATDWDAHKNNFLRGWIDDENVKNIYRIADVAEDIENIFEDINGLSFADGYLINTLYLSGTVEDAKSQLGELITAYSRVSDYDNETMAKLQKRYSEISNILENINTYSKNINLINAEPIPKSYVTSTENIDALKLILKNIENVREEWFKAVDEMENGSFKIADSLNAALQKVSSGEGLSNAEFWDIMEQDTKNVIQDVEMIGDQFYVNEKQLRSLRNQYIDGQIESLKATNETLKQSRDNELQTIEAAKNELQNLGRRGLSNDAYRQQFADAKKAIADAESSLSRYDEQLRLNNILMQQWYSKYNDIADKQKELEESMKKLQDQADKYAKAMTDAVQNVIDGLEDEKQQLEDEKQILDDQLDVLNERKESIEETIEQYKSLAGIVKDVTDAEIDALKEQQQVEEDAVQARIDALKEQHDMQEEENSLAEKELELRKKLAELDKAKSTKVRTYSAERGWHFDVDKEVVANAQAAADEAQEAYNDAVSDKEYNDQIKSLEAEKKAIAKNYEAEIKSYEDYYKQWSDITEEQSKAEEEQLAQQILGSDWREKIKTKDSNALAKFASDFRGYNAQLNSLVNGEIASLKKSIEAKEDEINAKNKQIDAWKRYKTQVENTIDDITNKYKDYTDVLGAATAAEGDSYETREEKLRNFATQYESLIGEINGYQSQIEGLTIPVYLDDKDAREKIGTLLDDYANAMSEMSRALEDTPRSMHKWVDDLRNIYGFSQGGVADFTGVTTVHGTKQRSETIFNASQSKELYDMVKSGSFVNVVADKAYAGLSSAISKISSTTDNSNRVININGLTIKADNPMQFHDQFIKEIGQYWNVKLTEVRTR